MADLVVHYARRSGRGLLFVNHAGEQRNPVAVCVLATGRVTFHDAQLRGPSMMLIKEWMRDHRRGEPAPAEPPMQTRAPMASRKSPDAPAYHLSTPYLPPLTPEDDLARNPPGAGLLEMIRAQEMEHAAPVRWMARLFHSELSTKEARRGLVGEQRVGAVLEPLKSAGWYVLHGVMRSAKTDIDHIVIGRPGVFTVNTKHHPGVSIWARDKVLRVNGSATDYLRSSETEQRHTSKVLKHWCGWPVPVQPVIAVVGARHFDVVFSKSGILVVDGERLDQESTRLPDLLTDVQAGKVFEVARHASIWRQGPVRRA